MSNGRFLICDCMGYANSVPLNESKKSLASGRITFTGPFTETERVNKNNRIYPDQIMRPEFDRLALLAQTGRLLGEADHPSDSIIHLKDVGMAITKLWWDSNKKTVGYGEAVTLNTPNGWVLEGILNEGFPIGVSSRGVGSGRMENGRLVISEGFRLVTWDGVCDPSYQDAWQTIKESVYADLAVGRKRIYMSGIQEEAHPASQAARVTQSIEEVLHLLPGGESLAPATPVIARPKLKLESLIKATASIAATRLREFED